MGDLAFFTLLFLPLEGWNFLGKRVFLIRELFLLIVHNNWLTEAFRLAKCLKELFFSLIFFIKCYQKWLKKGSPLSKIFPTFPHTMDVLQDDVPHYRDGPWASWGLAEQLREPWQQFPPEMLKTISYHLCHEKTPLNPCSRSPWCDWFRIFNVLLPPTQPQGIFRKN